jgi:hypothetical protein
VQNDLHGLCGCVHQLLHLQPLACCQEVPAALARRGLDLPGAAQLLGEAAKAGRDLGADGDSPVRPVQSSRWAQYTVPQASLKR